MTVETLAQALEREHHEVDAGIEAYLANPADGVGSLRQAVQALRRHIYLEEEILFPPLRNGGLMAPIFVMLREHGEIWRTLAELDAALATDPSGDAARRACRQLMDQLGRHNMKEEPVIYPQADQVLPDASAERLREFLVSGEMPEGWAAKAAGA